MKKLIILALVAFSTTSFAQSVKNGTIYKAHPYITKVNEMITAYVKYDTVAMAVSYADTVKFYDSPDPKPYNLAQAKLNWRNIHDEWEQIAITPRGYPDGLEYTSEGFVVQSWWTVTAVNRKTKKKATFEQAVFDTFNKAGKIVLELNYYDTSSLMEAMKP
ncbi:MAG: nuclear transport factor 2 family protein [Mucilaginibacter sp.]